MTVRYISADLGAIEANRAAGARVANPVAIRERSERTDGLRLEATVAGVARIVSNRDGTRVWLETEAPVLIEGK